MWHLNVRIFSVRVMECMCAQTGPQFVVSCSGPSKVNRMWGQTSSVGLAVLQDAVSRVHPSSEPLVEGIFPLQLNACNFTEFS